ncbi:MAG: DUF58 domain-containing protein [Chloroflexota bacterium]|nr:DUF58 domain-containing protein [Chloroflexota bacterium]
MIGLKKLRRNAVGRSDNRPLETGSARESSTISQVSQAWIYGAGILVGLGVVFGSRPLFAVGIVIAVALLVAWLWARWCFADLTLERRFSPPRAFWGEDVDMAHVFTNSKALPIPWLGIRDEYPSALSFAGSENHVRGTHTNRLHSSISLRWFERATKRYRLKATARGEHEFGPVELQSGDVFGLFRRQVSIETPQTLLVYPRYVPLEELGIAAHQPFGEFKTAQRLATDPVRVRTVREYAYGDNPRAIHWKATARRGSLQTKLFEPAATPQLYIFCNQDTFVQVREGLNVEALELTIVVAASIAAYALEQGHMVGLQVNSFVAGTDRQVKVPPSRDPDQLIRILEELARVKGWSGLPMEDLLRAEQRHLPMGATLVLVTGILSDDLVDMVLALRRAGYPVVLVHTGGPDRASASAGAYLADDLRAQGITFYSVDGVGKANEIEQLTF